MTTSWNTPRINLNFNAAASRFGAVWNGTHWKVDESFEAFEFEIQKAYAKYFEGEKCTLKVTAKQTITGRKSPVTFAGFIIGRDSGTRLGEGVVLIQGNVRSGGEINQDTVVEENSVLLISNFPVALVGEIISEKWSWEIYTPEDDGEEEEIEA